MSDEEYIDDAIEELIADGMMRVVSTNEAGERMLEITPDGELRIAQILDGAFESAVMSLSLILNLPPHITRDLLVNHVISMVFADQPDE